MFSFGKRSSESDKSSRMQVIKVTDDRRAKNSAIPSKDRKVTCDFNTSSDFGSSHCAKDKCHTETPSDAIEHGVQNTIRDAQLMLQKVCLCIEKLALLRKEVTNIIDCAGHYFVFMCSVHNTDGSAKLCSTKISEYKKEYVKAERLICQTFCTCETAKRSLICVINKVTRLQASQNDDTCSDEQYNDIQRTCSSILSTCERYICNAEAGIRYVEDMCEYFIRVEELCIKYIEHALQTQYETTQGICATDDLFESRTSDNRLSDTAQGKFSCAGQEALWEYVVQKYGQDNADVQ